MEISLEKLVVLAVSLPIGITLADLALQSYILPKLDKASKPYEMAYFEFKINPQGKTYWELVKEHKAHQDDPDYTAQLAKRLAQTNADSHYPSTSG